MLYGFSSLFSWLLFGKNFLSAFDFEDGVVVMVQSFFRYVSAFFYWFGGHIFGTEQFYNSLAGHPEFLYDFNAWAESTHQVNVQVFLPVLLGLIASIIVVWCLVRLIVKVCSLGKITY